MFEMDEDMMISATRGDVVFFEVTANDNETPYCFQPGDVVRITVYEKKAAENVYLRKDFFVTEPSYSVFIILDEKDTCFGDVISKAKDYWYEIEVNPDTMSQTIIGYDENGPKIFRLYPEGKEPELFAPEPEAIPLVDLALDLSSDRPVANRVVAMAIVQLTRAIEELKGQMEGS